MVIVRGEASAPSPRAYSLWVWPIEHVRCGEHVRSSRYAGAAERERPERCTDERAQSSRSADLRPRVQQDRDCGLGTTVAA